MELMIVVVIIGIVSTLAAPAIGRWRADQTAKDQAHAAVRLMNRARSLAATHGVAYVVDFDATMDNNSGGMTLWRTQVANNCLLPFGSLNCAGNAQCVDEARADSQTSQTAGSTQVFTRAVNGAGANIGNQVGICILPSGEMMWRNAVAANFVPASRNPPAPNMPGFLFRVYLSDDGGATPSNVARTTFLPFGGSARLD